MNTNLSIQAEPIVYRNGNNGHSMHKSDSLEEDLQRAISTAERRKVCIHSFALLFSLIKSNSLPLTTNTELIAFVTLFSTVVRSR